MAINQLSIFIENKAGTLFEITDVIAKNDIDIRAISIADTEDFGILRVIVSDVEKAKDVLKANNCVVSVTKVVGIVISDEPGSMSKIIGILSDNGINIEYMYAFITVSKKNAYVVLRVKDNEKAEKILREKGVQLISQDEILSI